MLSEHQFADPDRSADLRMHGENYVLHNPFNQKYIHAYPATRNEEGAVVHPAQARKQPVGSMQWFGGKPTPEDLAENSNTTPGTIYKVHVKPAHQRQGIATAMLHFARDQYPESQIRHSKALSPEGAAWAKAVR